MDKPPFDPIRAAFLLIAAVLGVQCIVVLAGVAFCWTATTSERCSELRGMLSELLTAALAAALAFSGGARKS